MSATSDLPSGVAAWTEATAGGTIVRLDRHVARREAWVVDVERPDGSIVEGFLRLERDPQPGDPWSLGWETEVVRALGPTGVPVPQVLGRSESPSATLFERVPGRSDLPAVSAAEQRSVMEHFMGIVAELHQLDLDDLGLDVPRPTTPAECALGEVDRILERWGGFLAGYTEPLVTFGVRWLRDNVPASVARVSLVQGDTGPVNFLFDAGKVTAVIDWEWAHLGDPMEDLGNICVREFWNPSGGLDGLFRLYSERSGIPYDPDAARYYRVQQNVRGMIPIHAITAHSSPTEPVAWYLAYRYVGDRATCEAIAEAMGVDVDAPELPEEGGGGDDVVADAAAYALEHDVMPALADPFARSRAGDVAILVRCLDRRRRHGDALAALERADLAAALGSRPDTVAAGLAELDARLRDRTIDDDVAIRYLTRRALRDEWLWAPSVALYPDRHWSPIDELSSSGTGA